MNIQKMSTSYIKLMIKHYEEKLEEMKHNYIEIELKDRYTRLLEKYVTEYVLRTGDLPSWKGC